MTPYSWLFPVCQRHQFGLDFLQPQQPSFLIRGRTRHLLATLQVDATRFADLCYFLPQLCDALFNRLLH